MKKRLGVIIIFLSIFIAVPALSQNPKNSEETKKSEQVDKKGEGVTKIIQKKFEEGGAVFMSFVLACLILGLAIAIERIITLNLATVNTKKFLGDVESALDEGGAEKARELCAKTRGPIASIIAQGLIRKNEGVVEVEKSIISYGSIEMGKLESGMSWISMFISLAPLLGFMGTVYGMIVTFDGIAESGDMEITQMAIGIKQALLTTIAGLIVAVILQVFHNYCVSKIDALVNQMEEASTHFVDMLLSRKESKL